MWPTRLDRRCAAFDRVVVSWRTRQNLRPLAPNERDGQAQGPASHPLPNPAHYERSDPMTLCPIALVAGCRQCLIVALCPLKGVIGDYRQPEQVPPPPPPADPPASGKR